MAELTAEQLNALMGNQRSIERNRSEMDEFRQQDIPAIISRLGDINGLLRDLLQTTSAFASASSKERDIQTEQTGDVSTELSPLEGISSHLKDIKEFLKETFTPDTSNFEDDNDKKDKEQPTSPTEMIMSKMDSGSKTAMGWLGGLFAVGALGELSKVLGIGAAGGTAGLLAKVAGKIFKFTGPVLRRIPILGSLFSFYEAYKKISAGGIDNTIFGLMDFAAGIAYAVPGLGTGIGIGIDVLQYFLKNKADEFKKESGDVSFFGSMYDKLIDYLSETPMIKWMVGVGDKFLALWNNPSFETLKEFGLHLAWGPLMPYINMFSMLDDAGAVLGLTDKEGNPQKLFSWLYDKVEDYIITPVKDMFTSVFDYVADIINSIQGSIGDMILKTVDSLPDFMGVRGTIKAALGLETTTDPDPGGEKNKLREKIKKKLSDVYPRDKAAMNRAEQKANTGSLPELKQQLKEMDNQLLKDATPINQPEKLPTLEQIDKEIINKAFGGAPNQSTVNQTQINTYVAPDAPSSRYRR